ncbi:hypothetical protein ACFPN0_26730 [Kitasatospora cinereorecta]
MMGLSRYSAKSLASVPEKFLRTGAECCRRRAQPPMMLVGQMVRDMAGELVSGAGGGGPDGDVALAACSPAVSHDARMTLQAATRRTAS